MKVYDVRRCHNCGEVVMQFVILGKKDPDYEKYLSHKRSIILPNCDVPITKHKANYWCKECGAKDPDIR